MSTSELIPALHELGRDDKLRILQFLVDDLAMLVTEDETLLKANASYPVWSPHDAFDAANVLLELLNNERDAKGDNAKH